MSNTTMMCRPSRCSSQYRQRRAVNQKSRYADGRQQGGYILIAAIVVMLVLSGIALTLAKLSISQNSVVEQAILRARTELTLDAGSQWITQVTLQLNACNPVRRNMFFDESGKNVNVGTASSYTVDTLCTAGLIYDEGGVLFNRFPTQVQVDYREATIEGGFRSLVVRRSVLEF